MKKNVLIVGGGFGGIYAANYLLKKGFKVTLFNEKNYFVFTPLLVGVVSGTLNSQDIIFDYLSFFKNKNFKFVRDKIEKVDFEKKQIIDNNKNKFDYDYLILSTGSETNFFGAKGAKENTLVIKNVDDAIKIKQKIIENLCFCRNDDLNINVIGAGPTGIELALEIRQFTNLILKRKSIRIHDFKVNINLINAMPNILPQLKEKNVDYVKSILKKFNINLILSSPVIKVEENKVFLKNKELNSGITIWAGGIQTRVSFIDKKYLDSRNNILVEDTFQIKTKSREFALGDIIGIENKNIPKLAQTAIAQGRVVGENIVRLERSNAMRNGMGDEIYLMKYKMKLKGVFISLGTGYAVGEAFGMNFRGKFGWFVWRTIYLTKMPGITNKIKIAFTWTIDLFVKKNLVEN